MNNQKNDMLITDNVMSFFMKTKIDEIEFIPVKPKNGLIGFVSFVLDEKLYCSSIGVHTRPQGGIRLVWPLTRTGMKAVYPISKELYFETEIAVADKVQSFLQ